MKVRARQNLIDRAVSYVAPLAGEQRLAARTRMVVSASLTGGTGGYRGAQPDRQKRRGILARPRSANADILPGSERRRAAERDAAMNQPIATAAINRMVTFAIGTGLMAIPAVNPVALGLTDEQADEWDRTLAADFDAYMSSKDVDAERKATGYGIQSIEYRGTITSGDILALRVMPEDQPGRVMETAWKLIEADRLRNPPSVTDGAMDPRTGNQITGGVETDRYGAPVAYHILRQHPGDLVIRPGVNVQPERIEAWDRDLDLPRVVHVFKKERPEQLRGVGMLATVLEPLRMISDATDAELYATVLSAMLAIIYKSPGATPMPEPNYGDDEGDGGIGQGGGQATERPPTDYTFEAGTTLEIDNDADVEIKTPGRPNSAFDPFFQAIVRQIGAAIGVPAGVLLLMFNSSYTASKAELEALYQHIRAERAWAGDDACKPIYVCFIAEKVARGDYAMSGFFSDPAIRAAWTHVDWRGDGKISLNPAQEANGFKIQQDNGWKTGEQITADLTGGSFRENIRKRGAEHRAWLDEGLPVAMTAGAPSAPANDDGAKKPAKGDDEDA